MAKNDLANIKNNVIKIDRFCHKIKLPFEKPLLILGTFERIGSNWLLETLNQDVNTHNEPFRQQFGKTSCYSTDSERLKCIEEASSSQESPFLMYWLETFVGTKYGTYKHVIKETNLFFALRNFLKFFPDSPVLILKREPLGIFSSFINQDLFNKWHYKERYEQLRQTSRLKDWKLFQFVFDDVGEKDISPIIMLTRLFFLNTLLIAQLIDNRRYGELSYEASIKDRSGALKFLSAKFFSGKKILDLKCGKLKKTKVPHGVFSTNRTKNSLESFLDEDDKTKIYFELDRLVAIAKRKFKPTVIKRTKNFLNYSKSQYSLIGRRSVNISSSPLKDMGLPVSVEFIRDKNQNLEWRNILVTNKEFCLFLNKLMSKGINNIFDGAQLFFNENMIHERGGRIHFNKIKQKHEVSTGYENHPVYWVTWLGALVFSIYSGLRLPRRSEINLLFKSTKISLEIINAEHKLDDVTPMTTKNCIRGEINDVVGNLAVWCLDGEKHLSGDPQSITRYIYGTSWNRQASLKEITKNHFRPIIGSSRSVGIRLVKDSSTKKITFEELVEKVKNIPVILREKNSLSLCDKDLAIIGLFDL